jgi:hypothetical protein
MMSTVNYPVPKAALMAKPGAKPGVKLIPLPKKAEAPIFLQSEFIRSSEWNGACL